ncbi:MAG: alpha/beta hydrolase [Chloroflexi bacterium]|nr:alpha/beta hydrolase [Chloroflexota bacterium]
MNSVIEEKTGLPSNGTIESLKLRIDGYQAHYLKAGSGSPVVLLHGGASDSGDWTDTMSALSPYYSLYAPDIIGYGKSDKNKSGYYLTEFVDFTLDFIKTLGLSSIALVGHSLGGRICLDIALHHPYTVRRLVLVDTVGFGKLAWWGTFLGAAAWGFREFMGRPQPYPKFLKEDTEDKDWQCLDKLTELKVPTLLIWNRRDPYFSVNHAFRAQKLIPEVSLEIFPGYGHAPHMKNREQFNNLLLDFLNHEQG